MRLRLSLAVLVASSMIPAVVLAAAPVEAGKLVASAGKVEIKKPGESGWSPMNLLDTVFVGATVRTTMESRAKFLMSDSSVLMLGESSEIEVNDYVTKQGTTNSVLTFFRGKMLAIIVRLANGDRGKYEISTPTAVAGVRGTYLALEVSEEEGKTDLMVQDGVVNLKNLLDNTSDGVNVQADQMSSVLPGVQPSPAAPLDQDRFRTLVNSIKSQLFVRMMPPIDIKAANADAAQKITVPPPKAGPATASLADQASQPLSVVPPVRQEIQPKAVDIPVTIQVGMPNADPADRRTVIGK